MNNLLKLSSKNTNIWFTSDTHYWHKNITYGVSDWPDKERTTRRFDTTQEMSQHLVSQINKYVGEDDILFHLGDWSFGGIDNIWNFRKQLKCKNIYLIEGNHDTHIKSDKLLPNCHYQDVDNNEIILLDGYDDNYPASAKQLFKEVHKYLEIEIDNKMICMMHYPIEEWNDRFKKSIHLFGHVHGRIPIGDKPRLDVGIDNAYILFNEYRPFSWSGIKKLLKF